MCQKNDNKLKKWVVWRRNIDRIVIDGSGLTLVAQVGANC